jgi:hypothetical protein
MKDTRRIFALLLCVCALAAGCGKSTPPTAADTPINGYDPNARTVAPAPQPPVKINSISDGDWNIDINPLLNWTANPQLGEIQFVSIQVFEVANGKAADAPCVTIDDTTGALARNNGGRIFDAPNGALICFMGSHLGTDRLKKGTSYMLVLKLIGTKSEGTASVRFSTKQ